MSRPVDARAYEASFHLASEAAAFVDASHAVMAVNPAFARLLDAAEGRPLADAFAPEERPRVEGFLRDARRWSEASLGAARTGRGRGGPVDLWASGFVGGEGEHLVLVRARSAQTRLEAERLHAASVLAARACNEASTLEDLSEGASRVVERVVPGVTGTGWLRREGAGWRVAGASGVLVPWRTLGSFPEGSLWTQLAHGQEAVLFADVSFELGDEHAAEALRLPPGSLIVVPVLARGAAESLFVGVGGSEAAFTLDDVRCVEALTREMASSILRLEAHEALARSHAELTRAFRENEALLSHVRRLNAELEDFALWTTHDLREPLRGVAALADYVADAAASGDVREAAQLARQLSSSATRLKGHIRGLHEFHELARDSGRRERVGLRALAREALAEAPEVDARLAVHGDAEVLADPSRLKLAMQAMLRYALPRARGPVEVVTEASPAGARLAVELRGEVTGRAAEAAFHLVVPGESLALARRIAIQHGGAMGFERRDRAWLVLTLPLPGAWEAEGPREAAPAQATAERAGRPASGLAGRGAG